MKSLFAMALALASPPRLQPAQAAMSIREGEQIVAIGDSITEAGGYLRAMDAVFRQQYPQMRIPRIVNTGIGGQKAEDLVERFGKDVLGRQPAVATINVGINDVWHRLDQPHDERVLAAYGRNLDRMVRMAQEQDIRACLISPTVIEEDPRSEGNQRLAGYVAAGKAVAAEAKCEYVDLHALFLNAIDRHHQQGGPDVTRSAGHLTEDGVHMRPIGDVLMAVGILRALGVPDEKMAATDLSKVIC